MIESIKAVKKIAGQYLGNAEALQSPELANEIREDVKKINVADIARGIREIRELLEFIDARIAQQKSEFGIEGMNTMRLLKKKQPMWRKTISTYTPEVKNIPMLLESPLRAGSQPRSQVFLHGWFFSL